MEEIVKRITQILHEQQLSSSAFADTIGVQRSSISHILSRRNKPSLEFIMKIVSAFPTYSTDWLLFGKSSESPTALPANKYDTPSTTSQQDIAFTEKSIIEERLKKSGATSKLNSEIDKLVLLYKDGRFTEYISKND